MLGCAVVLEGSDVEEYAFWKWDGESSEKSYSVGEGNCCYCGVLVGEDESVEETGESKSIQNTNKD